METRAPTACTGPVAPRGLSEPIFTDGTDRPGTNKQVNGNNPWARFVDRAAQRYRPGGTGGFHVQLWEVWNEPDLCQFWMGSVSEYARLVKVAYLVIKWRDPGATVLWGGLAHFEQPAFLDGLISQLRSSPMSAEFDGFFDGAAAHHYSVLSNGLEWTRRVRTKLDAVGWQHKPIWITESGVPICNDYPGPACDWQSTFSAWRAQPYEQAAYIWENIAYTRMAGGGPILQFMLHDDCGNVVAPNSPDGFGVVKNESSSYCSPAGAQTRVGYRAFQLAAQYLQDTELLWEEIQDGSVRQVAFYHHPTKERRLMTWALTAAGATARVAATGSSARRIAVDGVETALTPVNGQYQIGLPGYTNRNWWKGGSVYDVGIYGLPYLVVERDTQPPSATISGIAPQSPPSFAFQWQATDRGSGIGYVEVLYQLGDGPWRTHGTGLPASGTLAFTGIAGQHVRFAVLAVDRAGNTTPFVVAAQTDIVDAPPVVSVTGRVRRVNGAAAAGVAVAVGGVAGTTGAGGDFSLAVPPGTWNVQVAGQTVINGQAIGANTALDLLLPAAGNTVGNSGFAAGLTGWQQMGSSPLAVEALPGSSEPALHLATGFVANPPVPGEEGSTGGNSTVYQNVNVPAGQPYLAMMLRIDSAETSAGHDWFEVLVGFQGQNTQMLKFSTGRANAPVFVPMSAYAGRSVTLYLNVYQSSPNRRTSAWVDQVTLAVP